MHIHEERRREWATFQGDTLAALDSLLSTQTESPLADPVPHAINAYDILVSRPPFPQRQDEVATLLRHTFFASATARAFGLHLGDWYGLLSLRAQPHSPQEEVLLAGMMKRALSTLDEFLIASDRATLRPAVEAEISIEPITAVAASPPRGL